MSLQVGYLRPELQGCSPLASQQLIVTTWKFFLLETGELSIMQILFCIYALSPHMYTCPRAHHLAHRYRLSTTIRTMEDQHARWTPGSARNTQFPVSPWDDFYVGFFPSQSFSSPRFFRGFFFRGYIHES